MNAERMCLAFLLMTVICVVTGETQAQEIEASDKHTQREKEMSQSLGLPCVKVQYGPYSGYFVADTGAERSVAFTPNSLIENPDPSWSISTVRVAFANRVSDVRFIHGISISAFNEEAKAGALCFREGSKSLPLDGMLGMSELVNKRLHLDGHTQHCTMVDGGHEIVKNAVEVPLLNPQSLIPSISARFAFGINERFVLDTGNDGFLSINIERLKHMQRAGQAVRVQEIELASGLGLFKTDLYIIRTVEIAGFVFQNVPATGTEFRHILLGQRFFRQFDVVLDFPADKIYLAPYERPHVQQIPPDASGMSVQLLVDTGDLIISRVQSGGSASKSGLAVGDKIVLFDGEKPITFTTLDIRERLAQGGTSVALRILRDGKEFDHTLELKWPFEYPPKWKDISPEIESFGKFLQEQSKTPIKPK